MAIHPIQAVVQFVGGSAAEWIGSGAIIPLGLAVVDDVTKDVKIGDGEGTWDELDVLCNLNDYINFGATLAGLIAALDGKASAVHTHAIEDITNLSTVLDSKAPASHSHAISNISGLQEALDAKASSTHGHTISDISGLQTALDAKAPIGMNSRLHFAVTS